MRIIITVLGIIAIAALFFFAVIFALATALDAVTRLSISGFLFIMGISIAYYLTRKPKTIIQRLEMSGQMKAAAIKCPTCGASVDANQIKIVSGVPYATCSYCGSTFEVTEEPKW